MGANSLSIRRCVPPFRLTSVKFPNKNGRFRTLYGGKKLKAFYAECPMIFIVDQPFNITHPYFRAVQCADVPPAGHMDLPLSLLEMGCSGRFELITHPVASQPLLPQSTVSISTFPEAMSPFFCASINLVFWTLRATSDH